ncbi:LysR family transcriptional regulator [Streptomyces misionensis]|uniref:LysR family transcriptional regulator n=1 Tax=Streptomyces misionensis TaxID=67331 RepID=UPI00339F0278
MPASRSGRRSTGLRVSTSTSTVPQTRPLRIAYSLTPTTRGTCGVAQGEANLGQHRPHCFRPLAVPAGQARDLLDKRPPLAGDVLTRESPDSFTQAARILGLAQPTVTARIKSLEQALETPLLHRTASGASLTPAGRRLQRYARRSRHPDLATASVTGDSTRPGSRPRSPTPRAFVHRWDVEPGSTVSRPGQRRPPGRPSPGRWFRP